MATTARARRQGGGQVSRFAVRRSVQRWHGRQTKAPPLGWVNELEKLKNQGKSRVRAKVEHTIGVIKRVFGFQKVRYRGLAKNLHRLEVTAALANLYLVRRRLLAR